MELLSNFKKGFKYLTNSDYRFIINVSRHRCDSLSDEVFIKKMYRIMMGYDLNLDNPCTFNEKLQWIKLYDHNPLYTILADKVEAKKYVSKIIGCQYIVPTIGVWDDANKIDFTNLPEKYVLKCNHNSGEGMFICTDSTKVNSQNVIDNLSNALKTNYYYTTREWQYKNIVPKVLAEKYLENTDDSINGIIDYKFYCFNGEPKFFYLGYANIIDGKKHDQLSFFNMDWTSAPFYRTDHEQLPFNVKKPNKWEQMVEIVKKLSSGIPFVRIDLYYINEHIYFSEFTLTPGSGYGKFSPDEWENRIGTWIKLPKSIV